MIIQNNLGNYFKDKLGDNEVSRLLDDSLLLTDYTICYSPDDKIVENMNPRLVMASIEQTLTGRSTLQIEPKTYYNHWHYLSSFENVMNKVRDMHSLNMVITSLVMRKIKITGNFEVNKAIVNDMMKLFVPSIEDKGITNIKVLFEILGVKNNLSYNNQIDDELVNSIIYKLSYISREHCHHCYDIDVLDIVYPIAINELLYTICLDFAQDMESLTLTDQ